MTHKSVEWAAGVYMPSGWGEREELYLKRAYERGLEEGRRQVRDPIKRALGYVEAYEVKDD